MAKKIALLLSLVMLVSFSCVFATEGNETALPVENEIVSSSEDTELSGEPLISTAPSVDNNDEVSTSGDELLEEQVSGEISETNTDTTSTDTTETTENTESGNGTVFAGVIAIVIVVAVVAIVVVLKKD